MTINIHKLNLDTEQLTCSALLIQKFWRGYLREKKLMETHAIICIQKNWRLGNERDRIKKDLVMETIAVKMIQSSWRQHITHQNNLMEL